METQANPTAKLDFSGREYTSWSSMRQRCNNPRHHAFKNYGGRGIKICGRWGTFENFLTDMGPRPPGHTLERKDNNGDYCPENCIWIPRTEQSKNRRICKFYTLNGKTQSLPRWSQELQVPLHVLKARIINYRWDPERALTTPVGELRRRAFRIEFEGRVYSRSALAKKFGQRKHLLAQRLDRGWELHRALITPPEKQNRRSKL